MTVPLLRGLAFGDLPVDSTVETINVDQQVGTILIVRVPDHALSEQVYEQLFHAWDQARNQNPALRSVPMWVIPKSFEVSAIHLAPPGSVAPRQGGFQALPNLDVDLS